MPSAGPVRSRRVEYCAPPATKLPDVKVESKMAGSTYSMPGAVCQAAAPTPVKPHIPAVLGHRDGSKQNAVQIQNAAEETSSNTKELGQSHLECADASQRYWESALEIV